MKYWYDPSLETWEEYVARAETMYGRKYEGKRHEMPAWKYQDVLEHLEEYDSGEKEILTHGDRP